MRQNKASRLPSKQAYREVAASLDVPASGYKPPTYPVTAPHRQRTTGTTAQGEGEVTQTTGRERDGTRGIL